MFISAYDNNEYVYNEFVSLREIVLFLKYLNTPTQQ